MPTHIGAAVGRRTERAMNTLDGFAMCVLDCFKSSVAQHNFQSGDTLYDTSEAYSVWHTALKHIGFCVQVESATRRRDGKITVVVLRPNQHRTALVRTAAVRSTQELFVALLRDGDIQSFLDRHLSQTTAYV
jgi:hypothetical protein